MSAPSLRASQAASKQRGASLVVSLILLALMSMLALSAYDAGTINARVTSNMQIRNEALAAAQQAVDRTLSSALFTSDPAAVAATSLPVDIDGNGYVDYTSILSPRPRCYRSRIIPIGELDPARAEDLGCFASATSRNAGIETPAGFSSAGGSLCANTEWNVRAGVNDPRTSVSVAVNQGVGVRVSIVDATNACL